MSDPSECDVESKVEEQVEEHPSAPDNNEPTATPPASDASEPVGDAVSVGEVEESEPEDDPSPPTASPEEQRIQELELDNYNLTLRLERREKECDSLREEVADCSSKLVALTRDNERLEAQARDTTEPTDTSELYDRIADLETRLRAAEAKPKEKVKRVASTNPQHTARIKELEKELVEHKRASMAPSTSSIAMGNELKKAQAEIAQLRAALLQAKQSTASPVQHVSSHSRASMPHEVPHTSPEVRMPSNNSSQMPRSNPTSVNSAPPFLPGDRVLAWWEPGLGVGPKGWGADTPGWYPAVVVPFQSTTHVAVDWGGGTAPSTVPRTNVRLQQLVDTPQQAAKLASQVYVESPRSQARSSRHEVRQGSASVPRTASPTPMYDALQSVGTKTAASQLASNIMAQKAGSTGSSSFSVIGKLTPSEAEEAARRILEWELVKEGSASPQRASRGPSMSASPMRGEARRTSSPYARRYQ